MAAISRWRGRRRRHRQKGRSKGGGGSGSTFLWWVSFGCGAFLSVLVWLPGLTLWDIPGDKPQQTEMPVDATSGGTNGTSDERFVPEAPAARKSGPSVSQLPDEGESSPIDRVTVNVLVTDEQRVETVPIEAYVRGVVAGEMPADFEPEALKAQAIAARTYIVRKLRLNAGNAGNAGEASPRYDVTDATEDQVYIPAERLKKLRQTGAEAKLGAIERAVEATKGLIVTYDGEPIQAAFFSTSSGYTENSEDYWDQPLPYLRSVPSPWDKAVSPRYKQEVEMSLQEFYAKLGIKKKKKMPLRVTGLTEGRRVREFAVGAYTFTGRDTREKLGLPSSKFTWVVTGDRIVFTTYGYGHGVGMSQWGANALAKAGKTAEQILQYYYTGVRIEQASNL